MSTRTLLLLSPYGLPTDHPLMLSEGEMGAWLNGYLALWHPAVVAEAISPPKQASQYDHETPVAGHIYAIPSAPELHMPDDWRQRIVNSGACAFTATDNRVATFDDLKQMLPGMDPSPATAARLALSAEQVRPFTAIGFGYLIVEHLCDAMHHEHILASGEFWSHVQQAALAAGQGGGESNDEIRRHLQAAADKLLAAREVLYGATIHLMDIGLPNPAKLAESLPHVSPVLNLITSSEVLERMQAEHPALFAQIKQAVANPGPDQAVEIASGAVREREESLLPIESQLWTMRRARESIKNLVGAEVRVFGRRRTAISPQTPSLALAAGYEKAILLAFDGAAIPTHRSTVVNWSAPDNKSVDSLARTPLPSHLAQTFFNLVHSLHETIMQDTAATLILIQTEGTPCEPYFDWLELSRFGPILGKWTTFSRYFGDTHAGEYAPAAGVDDIAIDDLELRINAKVSDPISGLARHWKQRRRIDSAWTYTAILRVLGAADAADAVAHLEDDLVAAEARFEIGDSKPQPEIAELEQRAAKLLADRLQLRAEPNRPGYMVLNPCSFTRRVSVDLEDVAGPIPVEGPVKAAEFAGTSAKLVVEVPAFGYAWVPRSVPGVPAARPRLKTADGNMVRNEFLEAEIDPTTGGLKTLRDIKTRVSRIGQQLVFNPGSLMKVKEIKVTAAGAAFGEIVSEGGLLDSQGEVLATFRQRFRIWMGRPILDMRIEIYPVKAPEGYPWHAYYGARFAWRDERATLLRGCNGSAMISNHTRPVSPEFLELRYGQDRTAIFTGGLPFHQRHGSRMVDIILIAEHETCKTFDLALGMEREFPAQSALGITTPTTVVPTTKGPPAIGPSAWLFHVDAPNVMVPCLRPTNPSEGSKAAVTARMVETTTFGGMVELRCAKNPVRAASVDAVGQPIMDLTTADDAVRLELGGNELTQIRVEFP